MNIETRLLQLQITLRIMSEALDSLVGACTDGEGEPKTPSKKELLRAKAYLPPYCKNAFPKKEKLK
jgi:hypothetical protein